MNKEQLKQLEADLWAAADNLRANSDLKASEYSTPVLGLIFLKFADINYRRHEEAIRSEYEKLKGTRLEKPLHEIAVAKCGFFPPAHARNNTLARRRSRTWKTSWPRHHVMHQNRISTCFFPIEKRLNCFLRSG